jgi:hypothetical protein
MTWIDILLYLAIGLFIGLASGSLGIGGGVLLVPALVWLCRMDHATARGTTLAVLVVPVVLPAVLKYYEHRQLDLWAALWIATAFAVGGYLGATMVVQGHVPDRYLRVAFGLLMIYVAFRFIVHADSELAETAGALGATSVGWLTYLALRLIGRRYAPKPDLTEQIRIRHQEKPDELDYYI